MKLESIQRSMSLSLLAALVLTSTGAAHFAQADSTLINGAGATFPFPLYSKWFSEFEKIDPAVRINYQSVGSGAGIKQFTQKTVDFGATDAAMKAEDIAKAPGALLQIPTVMGAVVLTYNIPNVATGLHLDPLVIADIYRGKITKWNDSRIVADNTGIKLPDLAIMVVRRSDGSGTTNIFTDYLSKVSPDWKKEVGTGTAVNWPVGLGGKGNEGVSANVTQSPGAIGYVELIYAKKLNLAYASVKNQAGKFVEPSLTAVTAAADASLKDLIKDYTITITNAPGAASYPISGMTYLLVYQNMGKDKGEKLVRFLNWALKDGQKFAAELSYAPIPAGLLKNVQAKVASIKLQ